MPSEIEDGVGLVSVNNNESETGESLSLDEQNKRARPDVGSSLTTPDGTVIDKKDGPLPKENEDPSSANKRQKCDEAVSDGVIKTEPKSTAVAVANVGETKIATEPTSTVILVPKVEAANIKTEPKSTVIAEEEATKVGIDAPPPQDPAVTPGIKTELGEGTNPTKSIDNKAAVPSSLHDICEQTLGFKAGDRLEILWDISPEDEEAPAKDVTSSMNAAQTSADGAAAAKRETRWWGATLLPPDDPAQYFTFDDAEGDEALDRQRATIRVLDYDPYIEGGFPDKSLNDVVFISDKLVYDIEIRGTLIFRREGSTWLPSDEVITEAYAGIGPLSPANESTLAASNVSFTVDGTKASLLPILDSVLAKALAKVQPRLSSFPAARQLYIAEEVSKAKERLADKLVDEMQATGNRDITPQIIKLCMEEVGKELAALKQSSIDLHPNE